jgi:O-antigen/teichoic acid export membrane protein
LTVTEPIPSSHLPGHQPDTASETDGVRKRSRDRYRRALATTGANLVGRGIAILTAVAIVPLTLEYLGAERYGLWTTVISLAAFLVFADLGVGNGLMTMVAETVGANDREATARNVASGVWILAAIALAFAILSFIASVSVDWAGLFNIDDPTARAEAGPAMLALGLCYAVSLPLAAATHVRNGFQEGYINGAFVAAGNILGLVLVLVAVNLQLGLPFVVLAFMGAPLVAGMANALLLFTRRRWLIPYFGRVRAATSRALARTGGQFLVLQLAMAGAFYSDTLIAAGVIGPSAAAEYSVASTLFLVPMGLVAAGLAPLWPAYAEAMARGDAPWIRATLRRSLTIGLVVSLPSAILLAVLAEPILGAWIGGAVTPPAMLIIGMAIWTVLRGLGTGMAMLLNGLRLLRVQVMTAVAMAILNVSLSILLTAQFGVAGVIFGTVIAYATATLIPLSFYVPRVLRQLESIRPSS